MTTDSRKHRNDKNANPNWHFHQQSQSAKKGTPLRWIARIFKFLATAVLGYFMLTNWQPWLALSAKLAEMIKVVPFLDSLIAIPYLGGWIEWIFANLATLVGLLLWAVVQFVQISAMIIEDPHLLSMWIAHWDGKQFALRGDGGSLDQLKQVFNNFPLDWFAQLHRFRAYAYVLEIFVCFLYAAPYEGGMDAIVADFPYWDATLIDWWGVAAFLITVFAFERSFVMIWKLWQGVRYFR